MKTITSAQHLAISLSPFKFKTPVIIPNKGIQKDKDGKTVYQLVEISRFTKPGESQKDAIRRLMTGIKRRANAADPRNFPQVGTFKSTKEYVDLYFRINSALSLSPVSFNPLSTAPVDYEFDDAVVCEESDLV